MFFFSFSQDWFQVTLDQWIHRHKKWVPTGGNYVEKGQGSGKVKLGPVTEIYEFSVCFRIIYLMVKSVFFICLTLKLCDLGGDKQGYPQRLCNFH